MSKIIAGLLALLLNPFLYDCYLIELALLGAGWYLAVRPGVLPAELLKSAGRVWTKIAERRNLAYPLAFAIPIVARLILLPVYPMRAPFVPDEFSHLLLAETLAQGRLTNPTHPLWAFFESIHIFHTPTYNSMYLPGHAALLAIGIRLGGNAWWGVLLEAGLLSMGLLWALRGFFSSGWSLFGTMLFALRAGVLSYWTNSYWGGGLPAAGGALVLGACVRMPRRPGIVEGLALGTGISILAFTRPYEGLVFSTVCFLPAACRVIRGNRGFRIFLRQTVIPATALVMLSLGFLLSYFRAVTGNAFESPYGVNRKMYGWPMTLPWLKPVQVEYRHKELRDYYDWELEEHAEITTLGGMISSVGFRAEEAWSFFIGPAFSIALVMLPRMWRDRRVRLALVASASVFVLVLAEQSGYAHYHSPATAAYWVVLVQCLRHLRAKRARRTGWGLRAMAAVTISLLLIWPVRIWAPNLDWDPRHSKIDAWCCNTDFGQQRAEVLRKLSGMRGKHLAVVRYAQNKYSGLEWVYNAPDIDASQVVWARDMGWQQNQRLREYYSGRTAWLVEPDTHPVRVRPYEVAEQEEGGGVRRTTH